jgi:hypothetical protein
MMSMSDDRAKIVEGRATAAGIPKRDAAPVDDRYDRERQADP